MRSIQGKVGLWGIVILVVFPVVVWFLAKPLDLRFESGFMTLTSLGRIMGIIGMVLFSITLLLSARLHFLEPYFGGLDRIYNLHHKLGTIAFTFLLFHPLLLAFRAFSISYADIASFFLFGDDWPKNFGIVSFFLLMSLLSITFLAKWRYQILRYLHQILGVAFFFGGLHTFLIPSDIGSIPLLKWYMLVLAACAFLAYAYRTLLGNTLVSRYRYVVQNVKALDPTVTEVVMIPEGRRMHHIPGQFLFVSFTDGGIDPEVHPFSISSSPTEGTLCITMKALGDYTKAIRNLQVGSLAKIEGPFGSFTYLNGVHQDQIWIAGGIGITPFLSMARNLRVNTHTGHRIHFYYSAKTKQEMIFLNELEEISREYTNLHIIPFNADAFGFLTMDAVQKVSGSLKDKDIYVCGPPPMMNSIIQQCREKGVPKELIHSEQFKLL